MIHLVDVHIFSERDNFQNFSLAFPWTKPSKKEEFALPTTKDWQRWQNSFGRSCLPCYFCPFLFNTEAVIIPFRLCTGWFSMSFWSQLVCKRSAGTCQKLETETRFYHQFKGRNFGQHTVCSDDRRVKNFLEFWCIMSWKLWQTQILNKKIFI